MWVIRKKNWAPLRAAGFIAAGYLTAVTTLSSYVSPVWAGTYWAGEISRVSLDSQGQQANRDTSWNRFPTISADGRFIAFYSEASNLVAGDTNDREDIFVYDRETSSIERVSIGSGGIQGNGDSNGQAISGDGRYVAFSSSSDNLVPGDTNSSSDVFVHDRQTGVTERVSVASDGTQGFMGSGLLGNPAISADGRYVAFHATANNLTPGEDTNPFEDIFVHDRQTGETEMVSVTSDGFQASGSCMYPTISADGRYVAFESGSKLSIDDTNNETDIFVHDRQTGATELVSMNTDGSPADDRDSSYSQISGNGRYVVYRRNVDIFAYDRLTGQTEMINVTPSGAEDRAGGVLPPSAQMVVTLLISLRQRTWSLNQTYILASCFMIGTLVKPIG